MIVCAAGDVHGAIDRFYDNVLAFEQKLGVTFDWLLQVGDFGIWPDLAFVDGPTKRHGGAGDFLSWFESGRAAPRRTLFIKGNHEDFLWLERHPTGEVLPNLYFLPNGQTVTLDGSLKVGGVGGCYSPNDYGRKTGALQGYAKRHYTHEEVRALTEPLDIVLFHDAPSGVVFEKHRQGKGYVSCAKGLDRVLAVTKPRLCFFGHHHTRVDATVEYVPCVGLNKIPYPGSLMAVEMGLADWGVIGEG